MLRVSSARLSLPPGKSLTEKISKTRWGDLDESLCPYAYWPKSGDAKHDEITRDMVLAFGLDHIIIWSDRPKDPNASRYLENTANTRGKPTGFLGPLDDRIPTAAHSPMSCPSP
jgi:hypothetical protein